MYQGYCEGYYVVDRSDNTENEIDGSDYYIGVSQM